MAATDLTVIDGEPEGEDARAWGKLEAESEKAHKAFAFYRDLGENRSMYEAWLDYAEWNWGPERADEERDKGGRQAPRFFEEWAGEYDWSTRAEAYDRHVRRRKLREKERAHAEEIERYRERLKRYGETALETAIEGLERSQERVEEIRPEDFESMRDLTKFIKANRQLIDAARGSLEDALALDEIVDMLEIDGRLEE